MYTLKQMANIVAPDEPVKKTHSRLYRWASEGRIPIAFQYPHSRGYGRKWLFDNKGLHVALSLGPR
jgi:hypothetical protein